MINEKLITECLHLLKKSLSKIILAYSLVRLTKANVTVVHKNNYISNMEKILFHFDSSKIETFDS